MGRIVFAGAMSHVLDPDYYQRDMADMAALLKSGEVDFTELRRGAEVGGIWPA